MIRSLLERRRNTELSLPDIRAAYACASWLVGYPDEGLIERLPTISQIAGEIDRRLGDPLQKTVETLMNGDVLELCSQYVDTFDTRRKGSLFLTYYSNGDTRRRGMALVRIKDTYRRAGLEVCDTELPDHLTLVLEFAAGYDTAGGVKILTQNRPGVELLRLHLETIDSPWHGALAAVCATMPPLGDVDAQQMAELAANGPDSEEVGLDDGYGGDGYSLSYPPASQPGPTGCGSDAGTDQTPPRIPEGMRSFPLVAAPEEGGRS